MRFRTTSGGYEEGAFSRLLRSMTRTTVLAGVVLTALLASAATISFAAATAPGSPSCGPLEQEAERGLLRGDFRTLTDDSASGGRYVDTPPADADGASSVTFCFNIETAGRYQILASAQGIGGRSDSFFVAINEQPDDDHLWDLRVSETWRLDRVNDRRNRWRPVNLDLTTGSAIVEVKVREPGTRLDTIRLELMERTPISVVTAPSTTTTTPTETSIAPTTTAAPPTTPVTTPTTAPATTASTAPPTTPVPPTTAHPKPTTPPPTTAPPTTAPPTTPPPTTAPPKPNPGGPADTLVRVRADGCLGIPGDSTAHGAALELIDCDRGTSHQINFAPTDDGYGHLHLGHADRCITVAGSSWAAGAAIVQGDCGSAANQQWVPVDSYHSRTTTEFRSRLTGQCIAVNDGGTAATQEPCVGGGFHYRWISEVGRSNIGKGVPQHAPVSAAYHGTRQYTSFSNNTGLVDTWTYGDILFHAPAGEVSDGTARQWIAWYVRTDELYREVLDTPNFERIYRLTDSVYGRKKVVHIPVGATCGAGCGNKQKAEADRGFLTRMLTDPTDWEPHWIFMYEMGRGGSPEPFRGRAIWPAGTVLEPHLMAGVAYHEFGGNGGMERGIPGLLLAALTDWEQRDEEFIEVYDTKLSHDLMAAMMYRILQDTDTGTINRILDNMAAKPLATDAKQGMCDFQDAVNDATGGRYANRMTGLWGLPDYC